jgi:hypothetical protein
MALPDLVRRLVEVRLSKYCLDRIPPHIRSEIRLTHTIRGNSVTLIEERPFYLDRSRWTRSPVAQFRYDPETQKWNLRCRDRNGRWHLYSRLAPNKNFEALLREVNADPTGIFWG